MKNIVVVGGSSGIGLALIQQLEGENIANISRTPCVVAGVNNLTADVTDRAALKRAFDSLNRIDVLVYCAGASIAAPIECAEYEDYMNVYNVNLIGATECIRLAMPKLNASDCGQIIVLSSLGGITPIPFDCFYSAAKAGVIALCAALNTENDRVKSTAVVIGGTQTQFSFKRKVYKDCGEYDAEIKCASDSLIKKEQTGYSADFVANKIYKLIHTNNPPYKITVGFKTKLVSFLFRILPKHLRIALIKNAYDLP